MGLFFELQSRIKKSSLFLICAAITFYLLYHTITGERGFLRYMYLRHEVSQAEAVALNYHNQKNKLEDKVRLLSSSSLDLDMLDERAHEVLNLTGKDEFLILDEPV